MTQEDQNSKGGPMDEELGSLADKEVVTELTDELSSKVSLPEKKPHSPVVVLVGGYQGSGKTTTIDELAKDIAIFVISPDEIRHLLFARGWTVSPTFIHTVNATKIALLKRALDTGHHIVVDQLTTPARIDLTRQILSESGHAKYELKTAWLDTDDETLAQRVRARPHLPGRYRGKIDELKASQNKHGRPNLASYDLVIDTTLSTPQQTAAKIKPLFVR